MSATRQRRRGQRVWLQTGWVGAAFEPLTQRSSCMHPRMEAQDEAKAEAGAAAVVVALPAVPLPLALYAASTDAAA